MTRYLLYTEDYPSTSPDSPRQTGIGRYCSDLATGLAELGHVLSVLTVADHPTTDATSGTNLRIERAGHAPRWPHQLLRRAAVLRQRVASFRPDYLLVGDPLAHRVAAIARLSARVRYCPIFYGTELQTYRGAVGYRGWHPVTHLARSLITRYIRRAYQPICISRFTSGCLDALRLPLRRECIVFPAVSEPFLTQPVASDAAEATDDWRAARARDSANDAVRFITVARISERKNQFQVLEALAGLQRRHGIRFQYVIVGNIDSREHNAYLESIVQYTRAHALEDSVYLVGRTTDAQKIAWIDASDVFVMLSRSVGHSVEGFGISAIEASCRGKPVVVSDQGGMPETVLEGETGFSVSLDRPESILGPLLELARQPALRQTLGANGARFVRDNFTPRRMAERLITHLRALEGGPVVAPPDAYLPPRTQIRANS
jgi:glycosyltransferase involved in cell wall biosynthesis